MESVIESTGTEAYALVIREAVREGMGFAL